MRWRKLTFFYNTLYIISYQRSRSVDGTDLTFSGNGKKGHGNYQKKIGVTPENASVLIKDLNKNLNKNRFYTPPIKAYVGVKKIKA